MKQYGWVLWHACEASGNGVIEGDGGSYYFTTKEFSFLKGDKVSFEVSQGEAVKVEPLRAKDNATND